MSQTTRAVIDDFLDQKRIAFAGVSRKHNDFSRQLFRELLARGYDLIPVHPEAQEIEGIPAFRAVTGIQPAPGAVLIMTPPSQSLRIVEECAEAGIRRVWLYRAVGFGSLTPAAVEACDRHGIAVVAGECPFMFLPHAGWIHSLHRGFRALTGSLPR